MRNTIKVLLGFVWLGVIGYFFYFENHPYYLDTLNFMGRIIPGILVFAVLIAAIIGLQALWNKHKKRPILEFKVTLWKVLLSFFLLAAGVLTAGLLESDLATYHGGTIFQDELGWGVMPEGYALEEGMVEMVRNGTIIADSNAFISLLPADVSEGFTQVNLLSALAFTGWNLLIALAFLAVLTLAGFSIGHRILRLAKVSGFLMSMGVGIGVYMAVIFLLGLFGGIKIWTVGAAAVALTAVAWKDAWLFLKTAITGAYKTTIKLKSLSFWVFMAAILTFVYNAIDLVRPIPIGWDDTNYYLYIPKKIAAFGNLLEGAGGQYNWELINAIGAFAQNGMLQLFTNFWGGMLAMAAVYLFLNLFVSKKTSLTLTSLFYLLPAVIFQSSLDLKNDLALLFFLMLGAFTFIKWFKEDKAHWIYLAGIFVGIAAGIKSTAILAVIALVALLGWKVAKREGAASVIMIMIGGLLILMKGGNLYNIPGNVAYIAGIALLIAGIVVGIIGLSKKLNKKALKHAGAFLLLIALMLTPWMMKNLVIDGMPIAGNTFIATNSNTADIDFDAEIEGCQAVNMGDELSEYISGVGDEATAITPLSLFKMPWQMTMNPGESGIFIDMSMVFLGILPLIVWYFIEKKDKSYKVLLGISALYFAVLIFFMNGIIWYGFAGVCALLALTGIIMENYDKEGWREDKILSLIVKIAIGVTAFTVVLVKVAAWGGVEDLAYWGKIITEEEYIEAVAPGTTEAVEVIKEDPGNVFKIGGSIEYFLADANVKFIDDDSIDNIVCLMELYSDEEVIEIFRKKEVEYFSFDYRLLVYKQETMDPILVDRYIEFLNFGVANLEAYVATGDYALFKTP